MTLSLLDVLHNPIEPLAHACMIRRDVDVSPSESDSSVQPSRFNIICKSFLKKVCPKLWPRHPNCRLLSQLQEIQLHLNKEE